MSRVANTGDSHRPGERAYADRPMNGESIRVSIVEDDARVRGSFSRLVDQAPGFCCVSQHRSAEDALEALPAVRPHVVLMDINLPGINGIEAIRRIRALDPPLGRIPIIGVSGRGDDEAASRAAGADAFLVKPVSPRALATALLEATRRAVAAT